MEQIVLNDKKFCSNCRSYKTWIKPDGRPFWRTDGKGNWLCTRCHFRLIGNPRRKIETVRKWNKIQNPDYNPRKIWFKTKWIVLSFNPRKGLCSKCHKKGRTHMHHDFYITILPWACTRELCVGCHLGRLHVPKTPGFL